MSELIRFRCNQCGHRFESVVLSNGELREAQKLLRPTTKVRCSKCGGVNIRRV